MKYISIEKMRGGFNMNEDKESQHLKTNLMKYPVERGGIGFSVTKKEVIKSRGLKAMEQQVDMQMAKIREQIELLAKQVEELQKRKELSFQIYQADNSFEPLVGKAYYLYKKGDESRFLSMIAPGEWGKRENDNVFLAKVELLADRTWNIVD